MSVMALSPELFSYVRSSIETTAYTREANEFYCYHFARHFEGKDIQEESLRLVKSWCNLNDLSYAGKYAHHGEEVEGTSEDIFAAIWETTAIQTLKHLKCIRYNIETEYFATDEQDHSDLKLLSLYISELKDAILDHLPEYEAANWG